MVKPVGICQKLIENLTVPNVTNKLSKLESFSRNFEYEWYSSNNFSTE